MMRWLFAGMFLLLGVQALAALPPAPPAWDGPLIDTLAYADATAAAAAWPAMGATDPASIAAWGDRRALRLPCAFRGRQVDRASWDRAVTLDLAACRGLRFDLYCADPSPIVQFSFYLHCAGGWYAGTFSPGKRPGWTSVFIDKNAMKKEGTPVGWSAIDAIRISAWRGADADTEFYLANLALEGADTPVVILQSDALIASSPAEASTVTSVVKTCAGLLDRQQVPYVIMSDLEATGPRLQGKSIAVLPYNPRVEPVLLAALAAFVRDGGKLVACYQTPPALAELIGVKIGQYQRETYRGYFASIRREGDGLPGMPEIVGQASWNIMRAQPIERRGRVVATWHTNAGESTHEPAIIASATGAFVTHVLVNDDAPAKSALLLALLGALDPRVWEETAARRLRLVGAFAGQVVFSDAARSIRQAAQGEPRTLQALADAEARWREAVAANAARRFPEAVATAQRAQEAAILAYCAAQQPKPGEHRAWWCHSGLGVAGFSWDQAVKALAENGFTAVIPNMLWGGVAYYPSEVLPVAPEVAAQGDQLAACVAACRKYGVACHVWKVNWNMGYQAPKAFVERMQREGRTQVRYDGTPEPRWLCPSHPENRELEIASMVEVATKYDVDGLHFDYIRYPDASYCFCAGCRARFEQAQGATVANWPADTRNNPEVRRRWLDFRRDNITRVVAGVREAVRKVKPRVKLSAAVFPNAEIDRDTVAQDWQLWCARGYLDFICPMDYTSSPVLFEALAARQRAQAGAVPCYPGIGLSTWEGDLDAVNLIEHIQAARRAGCPGFTIFNYAANEATRILPLCGAGITRNEAGTATGQGR